MMIFWSSPRKWMLRRPELSTSDLHPKSVTEPLTIWHRRHCGSAPDCDEFDLNYSYRADARLPPVDFTPTPGIKALDKMA